MGTLATFSKRLVDILNAPLLQLTSRKPLCLDLRPVDIKSRWKHGRKVVNSHLVCDATIRQPGFYLPRQLFIFDHVTFIQLKYAVVYKISWKSDYFSLRYGDISIFKMADVPHLGIVLPPYETTHKVSVACRSCLSNFMSIWYTDLKLFEFFAYLAWNAYSDSQNGGFGGLWTSKCDYSSSRSPKHPCVNPRLLSYQL